MATDTRGVFALIEVVDVALSDEWVNLNDVFILISPLLTPPGTGYFGGGGTPSAVSTTDKLTYSTDTTVFTPSANLSSPRGSLAATGSTTAGYFGGGFPSLSTMDKITYATDTTAATPSAFLIDGRARPAATGNSTDGYFAGGVTTMDKLTYSSDTTVRAPSSANLSVGRTGLSATGNSDAGYFGGGFSSSVPGTVTTMDKLTYSTDTTAAAPSANLSSSRYGCGATGNSNFGYFGGGRSGTSTTPLSRMDKITYSTDTTAYTPSANLSAIRYLLAATGNLTAGYFGGGSIFPASPSAVSRMDKIDYSTDTTAFTPGANLSAARWLHAASSAEANAIFSLYYRFSDGVRLPEIPQNPTPTPETSLAPGTVTTPNTGYFGGGALPASVSTVDKIDYSTDTTTYTPSANLPTTNNYYGSVGSLTDGYFGGGNAPSFSSRMDKLTYSTDTTVFTPNANLSTVRNTLTATGNTTDGYFGGGRVPARVSTMDKLTYSTDTTVYTPGANLSSARNYLAATGNSTDGYFGGGSLPALVSTVDKLTYSTDTTAVAPSANLTAARRYHAATGNSTAGYFGGGNAPGTTSTIDKLTYSTDTTAATPSGANLTVARSTLGATGNSTDGYFSGGFVPARVSRTDKLTYSTDTTVFTPSANLSNSRNRVSGLSARENALPETYPGLTPTPNIV